ncbi:MAG: PASTA domain-containing protein [Bacteroidales bacterium]|jgi:serine/threonine-protein kinase|nr:PASTA domain-containing protein [Bacteroidales bacterium]MBQ1754077.1 PASTA domain-containing protein [Bacteroidales bacterium]MBQ1831161.1 PASTA domain-containing protein [Bacteroidales bacterium]MBQ2148346.1 PASTA domain-containing protein [Bacteroidales bacterium]MBQ2194423.1 PASTA domain-containing protein [Bacteroidales bacterium]
MEVDKDNKPTSRWIIRNILLAIAFFAVLLVLTQMGLKAITRHNQVIIVPDLTGLSVADAKIVAKRNHIRTEVVDSVYVKRIEKGNVFSQNPAAGKEVKKDRVIKLTINAHQTKMVKMPNLVGYSLRQAKTEILSSGLSVGKLAYREDIATNNVLDQFIKGRYVAPGTEVEAETPVDLLLGLSPDENETFIPYLIGYTLAVARDNLFENSLNLGNVTYDETVESYQDSVSAIVYQQSPAYSPGAPVRMGATIHLKLTTSQAKIAAR